MDKNFWLQKWETNDIAFHGSEANPLLVKYFEKLKLPEDSRIFLPLCGKTLDIAWLLSRGFRVAGAELSELAIQQLFSDLKVTPHISIVGPLKHYSAPDTDIFVGDIFDVSNHILGKIDAVYDRAALVALPQALRGRYVEHLLVITQNAPQLLISYAYDQNLMDGPPFAVTNDEVRRHYDGPYDVCLLESYEIPGGLKGQCPARENIWQLKGDS